MADCSIHNGGRGLRNQNGDTASYLVSNNLPRNICHFLRIVDILTILSACGGLRVEKQRFLVG